MISVEASDAFNIWAHSDHVLRLYRDRARNVVEEMTCAGQAAELLAEIARPGESLLDVGCGSGWFLHSLRRRALNLKYWGVDRTRAFVEIGREELVRFGLPPERLVAGEIEQVAGEVDHALCMNVLSNIDNWHRALDRLTVIARRSIILRESIAAQSAYAFVEDRFLDPGVRLKVHVNTYGYTEIADSLDRAGFDARKIVDRRTGGRPELVIGYPHHWAFVVAVRRELAFGDGP